MTIENEQRHSYRVSLDRQAVIQIGRRQIIVQLNDVSADGFAIASKKRLRLRSGKVYRLRTSSGWSEVVLARENKADGMRHYGLLRVADMPDPRARAKALSMPGERLMHAPPKERLASRGFFIALAFAGLVFGYYALHGGFPTVHDFLAGVGIH